ncbi:MAG: prephenate dehydratase [Bacteroidota bacterium]
MEKLKIGIQGIKASFHDMAARAYFKDREIEIVEIRDFRTLAEITANGEVDYSMMAIENTIGGSLLPNYGFIREFGLKVLGEEYLRISMQLMAMPGTKIEDVTEVISHHMAIRQSLSFLREHPDWKVSEVADTAASARKVVDEKLEGVAAIAGCLAAKTYGLEIISPDIETNKQNYTRFLVVANKGENHVDESDKSSVRLILSHTPGSLSHALQVLHEYGLNLTKIQSVPIIGKPYEYAIHFDIEYSDYTIYQVAMDKIKTLALETNILGVYKKGAAPVKV